jgi:hypothetical protein
MVAIEKIDTQLAKQVQRFVRIPFMLYKDNPRWVPSLLLDAKTQLNRQKHPFFEHSDADFFIAVKDGRDVGRIAALVNKPYNDYHGKKQAQFYLFESVNDPNVACRLFEAVFDWARSRGLDQVVGPKGFSSFDGYGILVEGFEHRQMMNMMNYNEPYLPVLVEAQGFRKEVDFVSCYLSDKEFQMPERIHRIAERVLQRSSLAVQRFSTKSELKAWANRIGRAYNQTFINNWEYYPLTDREIQFVVDTLMQVADPRLIKIITDGEKVAGFLLAFHDVSAALKRANGHLLPFGLPDILMEMRRTKWVSLNGAGILPEYQGRGGNALLYAEMENTIREYSFQHAELTQVAETAVQMRQDLANVGAKAYKNHRVYHLDFL